MANQELEWKITIADADWEGTRVGFHLRENNDVTTVNFHHDEFLSKVNVPPATNPRLELSHAIS